jgi:enamine deaminase RidA (YjgF/YER057c/UK114 family)
MGRRTASSSPPIVHPLITHIVGGHAVAMSFDARVDELGLALPPALVAPAGVVIPFVWARLARDRVILSGHGAVGADGTAVGPFGKVPSEVSLADAQSSARVAGLGLLGSLRRVLGTLDRVEAWLVVTGFVNADPGYAQTTAVVNPASDLLLAVFGDAGRHARTAIGVAALPLDLPVVLAAEVLVRS